MRADRLLRLLHLLQRHGRLPASRLAELLDVSERTVLRDMEALSSAGVPVYLARGRHGGCGLVEGYRTDVSGLTTGEAQALFAWSGTSHAATSADLGLGPELGNALAKLAATVPGGALDEADALASVLVVDRRRWFASAEQVPELPALREAAAAGRRVRLRYRSSTHDEPVVRTVDPWGLVENAGRWYLLAAHRRERRIYRVSRIAGLAVLDEPAWRPDGFDLATEWAASRRRLEVGESVRLDVAVESDRLDLFRRLASFQLVSDTTLERLDDEPGDPRSRWRLHMRTGRQAIGLLLTLAGDVELLAPSELRAELVERAEAALARHRADAGPTTGSPPTRARS